MAGPPADAWLLLPELRPDLAPTEMPSELRRLPEERAVEPREASLNVTEPREASLLAAAEPRWLRRECIALSRPWRAAVLR